jgi:hypothetical protein
MAKLFEERPAGTVAIVEPPVSRSYARKAWIAFVAVAVGAGMVLSLGLATVLDPIPAVSLGAVAGAACGFVVAVLIRVWPVLRVLWHWATEIVLAGTVIGATSLLTWATHPLLALTLLVLAASGLAAVGRTRRFLRAWAWCVIVRHRLRLCFAEFIRAASRVRPGSLPLILVARPTPAGERVWVWLPPGLDFADLESRADKLAVACWAGEVRVVRASARFAALVRVDVARRDPLAALVPSPLASAGRAVDELAAPPANRWSGLDLADVPEELINPPRSTGRR